jgi:glutamate N-acetyltransferase/amino-acid N-acetyltransferase
MTTDTLPKLRSRLVQLSDGRRLVMTGMAKGAGMIKPDMATMLAFIATDAPLQEGWLAKLLQQAVAQSFNAITVDGDTSTNDACVLMATGQAGGSPLTPDSLDGQIFAEALTSLMVELAQGIVRDAEGATRFMEVRIEGARTEQEARQVAFTVAESPLVKTAAFAADPNWGRILAAIGRSGLESLDISGVHLWMDEVRLIAQGQPDPDYAEERGAAVAARPEYTVRAVLNRGPAMARVWTCDYSYDYVRINAEYRS